jgi:hypothetical protein
MIHVVTGKARRNGKPKKSVFTCMETILEDLLDAQVEEGEDGSCPKKPISSIGFALMRSGK